MDDTFEDFEDAEILRNKIESKVDTRNDFKPQFKEEEDVEDLSFGEITNHSDLRDKVKYLHRIEKEHAEVSERLKKINQGKKKLRSKIAVYMNLHEIDELKLPEGVIYSLSKTTRTINPLTGKRLPVNISKWLIEKENMTPSGADEKSNEMIKYFRSKAEKVERMCLRKHK